MIDAVDHRLIAAVQAGLPITARPYAAIAEDLGLSEQDVIQRLSRLRAQGLIKRWGWLSSIANSATGPMQ